MVVITNAFFSSKARINCNRLQTQSHVSTKLEEKESIVLTYGLGHVTGAQ